MRWLTWCLAGGWVGVHVLLWTVLPPVPRWAAPGFTPQSVAFTPDGRSLVSCDRAAVSVFDVLTGHREHDWPRTGRRPGDEDSESLLVMSPTDRRAIVYDTRGGNRERPHLIDLDTGVWTVLPAWEFLVPSTDPCVGFLPGGRTGYQLDVVMKPKIDVFMRVWDLPDGPPRRIPVEWRFYERPSASADGRRVAALLHRPDPVPATVLILDLDAARIVRTLTFDRRTTHAALSPDGQTLAVCFQVPRGGVYGDDTELWGTETGVRIAALGEGFAPGWNADNRLVVLDDGSGLRGERAPRGGEIVRWPVEPSRAELSADGRFVTVWHYRRTPAVVGWLFDLVRGRPAGLDDIEFAYTVYDARTGHARAAVPVAFKTEVTLSADGAALATADGHGLRVWDIPPRRPGGGVLGLMIAQLGLLTAWTAWRRTRPARRAL